MFGSTLALVLALAAGAAFLAARARELRELCLTALFMALFWASARVEVAYGAAHHYSPTAAAPLLAVHRLLNRAARRVLAKSFGRPARE